MSTNKVYGDNPNKLPLVEKSTRWEIKNNHSFKNGIQKTCQLITVYIVFLELQRVMLILPCKNMEKILV